MFVKKGENTVFQILSIFSVLANPVRTSTRPQTSSKAFGIISGLFGSILTKEIHLLPKNRQRTAGTSSTQKCLFWGILANLVHRVGGWILIFSQNEYDFRNQHPKNVQKQLVQVENRKKGLMSPLPPDLAHHPQHHFQWEKWF